MTDETEAAGSAICLARQAADILADPRSTRSLRAATLVRLCLVSRETSTRALTQAYNALLDPRAEEP